MESSELRLLTRFEEWQSCIPEKRLYTFLDEKKEISSLSYKEAYDKVTALANYLVSDELAAKINLKLRRGDRILLVYPPSLDFIIAFLAVLYAGFIPVPVYPPDPDRLPKDIIMFATIVEDCKPFLALTNTMYDYAKKIAQLKQKFILTKPTVNWPELSWIITDKKFDVTTSINKAMDKKSDSSTINEHIAFLQYTSGSTSDPKGVMISFDNLNHNLEVISKALKADQNTVVVSWLPQYHDMGLIGSYLGILYNGGSGYYMSPFTFIRNPCCWLQYISQFKATHIQAPNFAYSLVSRKFKQISKDGKPAIDLSSLRHIINAAEPLNLDAISSFIDTFTKYGLNPDAIMPTYGLAEHTVFVCDGGRTVLFVDQQKIQEEGKIHILRKENLLDLSSKSGNAMKQNENEKCIISCGKIDPSNAIKVKIVDNDTSREVLDGEIGEIWINSGSKALGYYGRRDMTEEVFKSKICRSTDSDDTCDREYVKTGDLGIICDGELFVCGRIKDMIIIRGKNHFPQDIEGVMEKHEFVRPGCTAAFSCPSLFPEVDEENLVVIAELRDTNISSEQKENFCKLIVESISNEHGVKPSCIALLEPRSIIKTTSGKISRQKCRREFIQKRLKEVYRYYTGRAGTFEEEEHQDKEVRTSIMSGENTRTNIAASRNSLDRVQLDDKTIEINQYLCEQIANLLEEDIGNVHTTSTLSSLGFDSLSLTQLGGIIANRYHVEIDPNVLYNPQTAVNELQRCILSSEKLTGPSHPTTIEINESPTGNNPKSHSNKKRFCWCC